MSIFEDINADNQRVVRQAWYGTVAKTVANINDLMEIIVPELAGSEFKITEARWQSRDALSLPVRGDECLVVFDNRSNPWVVAWWPF